MLRIFILTFRVKEVLLTCIEIEPGRMQAGNHVDGSHSCYYLRNLEISQQQGRAEPKEGRTGSWGHCVIPWIYPYLKPGLRLDSPDNWVNVFPFWGSVFCYWHQKIRWVHGSFLFWHKATKILLNKQFLQAQTQLECIRPWIISNYCKKYIITVDEKVPNLSCDKISVKWYNETLWLPSARRLPDHLLVSRSF